MLEIKNLTKYYGNVLGVKDLSLKINKGEIFGFIGPNGAGKSTTIRCIMNMINKTQGSIFINNEEIKKNDYLTKQNIGYLGSEIHLYEDMNVLDLINYNASFYKKESIKKAKKLVKELELPLKKKVSELSLGNGKKLGIVLALMHDPDLIILDEATSGLDPLMQEKFYEILQNEKNNGKTIFFSSHNLAEIKKICDRIGIIKEGKLLTVEKIEDIIDNSFNFVTVISKDINKIKNKLKSKIVLENEKTLKFMYEGNSNDLIRLLSELNLDKILIEEPSIEEIFMHYYK